MNFMEKLTLSSGDLDVLDGSPPCSEFSTAGKGIVEPEIFKSYSDGKQRDISSLAFEFARFALFTLPKVVVMENVPALATRGTDVLSGVKQLLSEQYLVNWQVLDASQFGVPQKRKRLFVLGTRKDVAEVVGISSDDQISSLFPTGNRTVSIRNAFAGLTQTSEDLHSWVNSARTSTLGSAISRLPKCPARLTRPQHITPNDLKNFTLTRCSWDLPAPTLTVTGQQPSGLSGAIHPEEDRKFTLPELKRLFGLPDDFILTGTVAQAAERICRMVPPALTEAIGKSVYERVLQPYKESQS